MMNVALGELCEEVADIVVRKLVMYMDRPSNCPFNPSRIKEKTAEATISKPTKPEIGEMFLTASHMTEKLNVSRTTLWRMKRAGKLPRARRISTNRVVWLRSEVEQWMIS